MSNVYSITIKIDIGDNIYKLIATLSDVAEQYPYAEFDDIECGRLVFKIPSKKEDTDEKTRSMENNT